MRRRLRAGGDEGGDPALHVDRAAAVEQAAADLGRERVARPALARRHHVEMAGEGEMRARRRRASRTDSRPARPAPRRAMKRWTAKPSGVSASSSTSNTAPRGGRDAGAGDQPCGEVDGVDCGGHRDRPSIAAREKRHAEARSRCDRTDQPHRLSAAVSTRRWPGATTAGSRRRRGSRISASAMSCSSPAASPASATGTRARTSSWSCSTGEAVLVEDEGETVDAAGRLRRLSQGRRQRPSSGQPQRTRPASSSPSAAGRRRDCHYPDIDLHLATAPSGRAITPQGRRSRLT